MTRVLRITDPAQQDLEELWQNFADYGESFADRRLAEIQNKFLKLLQFPGLGRSREDLLPGLRSIVVRDIIILYRSLEGLILIVRVVSKISYECSRCIACTISGIDRFSRCFTLGKTLQHRIRDDGAECDRRLTDGRESTTLVKLSSGRRTL
jgi:toxin ParE1/3/4